MFSTMNVIGTDVTDSSSMEPAQMGESRKKAAQNVGKSRKKVAQNVGKSRPRQIYGHKMMWESPTRLNW